MKRFLVAFVAVWLFGVTALASVYGTYSAEVTLPSGACRSDWVTVMGGLRDALVRSGMRVAFYSDYIPLELAMQYEENIDSMQVVQDVDIFTDSSVWPGVRVTSKFYVNASIDSGQQSYLTGESQKIVSWVIGNVQRVSPSLKSNCDAQGRPASETRPAVTAFAFDSRVRVPSGISDANDNKSCIENQKIIRVPALLELSLNQSFGEGGCYLQPNLIAPTARFLESALRDAGYVLDRHWASRSDQDWYWWNMPGSSDQLLIYLSASTDGAQTFIYWNRIIRPAKPA